ncbi:hypothetical protein OS914_14130 [Arthrobacter sp. H14-L1]|nr:hypothetical protein [Arthrobacter sp. H14-L1]
MIAASTPEPPLMERVLAAPDHAPEAEKQAAGLLTRMAVVRLESLAELGLLTIDTHFRVPPAVVANVADVFDNEQLLEDLGLAEVPDDPDPEPGGPSSCPPICRSTRSTTESRFYSDGSTTTCTISRRTNTEVHLRTGGPGRRR